MVARLTLRGQPGGSNCGCGKNLPNGAAIASAVARFFKHHEPDIQHVHGPLQPSPTRPGVLRICQFCKRQGRHQELKCCPFVHLEDPAQGPGFTVPFPSCTTPSDNRNSIRFSGKLPLPGRVYGKMGCELPPRDLEHQQKVWWLDKWLCGWFTEEVNAGTPLEIVIIPVLSRDKGRVRFAFVLMMPQRFSGGSATR
jgi:hypothetical protein